MATCLGCTFTLWMISYWVVRSAMLVSPTGCDWTGSAIPSDGSRNRVYAIYLHCSQGRVVWNYPDGALRVMLQHGTSGREFRGCIRMVPNFGGARIYLEGKRRLLHLLNATDDESAVKCFNSVRGLAALYIEADRPRNSFKKATAGFSYDLKILPKDSMNDDMADCRPCTESEMLTSFCSSDWVLRGTVSALYNNEKLQETEMTVRVSKVLRHSGELGDLWKQKSELARFFKDAKYTIIHRPLKCGTKAGSGEYVFMGRWMLGKPVVNCVPRYSEWKQIRRKALAEGTDQCILNV